MLGLRLLMPFATTAALVSGVRVLRWATADPLRAVRDGTATVDDSVGATAGVGAWVLLTWVVVVLVVTALAAVPGVVGRTASRIGQRFTPATTRRLARLALGLAVATGPAVLAGPAVATGPAATGPAAATGPGFSSAGHVAGTSTLDVEPTGSDRFADLPLIDRPTRPDQVPITVTADQPTSGADQPTSGADQPASDPDQPTGGVVVPPTRDDEPEEHTITVRRGDTLWAIAADYLGPDAGPDEIAAEWPRWHEANRQVIGDDPDLIMPGIILQNPHELGDRNP